MKRLFFLSFFVLVSFTFVAAQCNGGGNGNYGNGYGNGGYGYNGNGTNWGNNNSWGNTHWPQFVINWLQNGGQVPLPLAVMVIHEARGWGLSNFGLSQGQMLQRYASGLLTIEYVSTAPPTLTFRIGYAGSSISPAILRDI